MTRVSDADFRRFQVRVGMRRVDCAILDEALDAASGLTPPSSAVLRRKSFDRFRTLINAAAELKLNTLPAGFIGRIVLTTEDLRGVSPEPGVPSFGTSSRAMSRPASLSGGAPAIASGDAAPGGPVT